MKKDDLIEQLAAKYCLTEDGPCAHCRRSVEQQDWPLIAEFFAEWLSEIPLEDEHGEGCDLGERWKQEMASDA